MTSQVVGRQPAVVRIVPSNPCPWYGQVTGAQSVSGFLLGGDRFTTQQVAELERRCIAPDDVPALLVRRYARHDEAWWGTGEPPRFEFACPIVTEHADGRRMVIAPMGVLKLVEGDGWISAPGRSKWRRAA